MKLYLNSVNVELKIYFYHPNKFDRREMLKFIKRSSVLLYLLYEQNHQHNDR